MAFKHDAVLWYNVGLWGEKGFAVPNWGDDTHTLNQTVWNFTQVVGRNVQAILNHPDSELRVPPSPNTLVRIHKLCTRARAILMGRAVPEGHLYMEAVHTLPAPEEFIVFPTPFFKVRNSWMKEYAAYALAALSECFQFTDNRRPVEISQQFAGSVYQYIHRIYQLMVLELLPGQFAIEDVEKRDFTLPDGFERNYTPSKWFTSTEMIDTVSPLNMVPTEDDLGPLSEGFPVTSLPALGRWPSGTVVPTPGVAGTTGPSTPVGNRVVVLNPPSP